MTNKRIARMLAILSIMFLALIVYMTVFDVLHHDEYAQSYANERLTFVRRGKITDRNGVILAESKGKVAEQYRVYPYNELYCHIIGYNSKVYSTSRIENEYDNELLGASSEPVLGDFVTMANDVKYMFKTGNDEQNGHDIQLTIDNRLQQLSRDALVNYCMRKGISQRGSVVAIDPQTGEVLAMVSLPDYDPNPESYDENAEDLAKAENKPTQARAYEETYAPGSTNKIITACALFEKGRENFVVDETDIDSLKDKSSQNYRNSSRDDHRTLEEAFKASSNIYFSEAANELGLDAITSQAENFMYGKEIPFDNLKVTKSILNPAGKDVASIRTLALGTNGMQATPLHMALIASTIANDGEMPRPHIIKDIPGFIGFSQNRTPLARCVSTQTADNVKELMYKVVNEGGTGTAAAIPGYDVCGKTGTADLSSQTGSANAIFIGFAPKNNPKIAVAVVLNNLPNGTSGGGDAAPIAKTVMQAYLTDSY